MTEIWDASCHAFQMSRTPTQYFAFRSARYTTKYSYITGFSAVRQTRESCEGEQFVDLLVDLWGDFWDDLEGTEVLDDLLRLRRPDDHGGYLHNDAR